MPQLLKDGLPPRPTRSKFDFSEWADGRSWKFVKGQDYDSATETFRLNVRKWARVNGFDVELRAFPALDSAGREVPLTKADAVALGVRFFRVDESTNGGTPAAREP
jgi:hypothetical protein